MRSALLRATLGLLALVAIGGVARAGDLVVSWTPPTANADGTTPADVQGYKLMYSRTADVSSPVVVTIDDPGLTSYLLHDLAPGDWYVVMRAYSATAGDSDRSNVAHAVVPEPPRPPSTPSKPRPPVITVTVQVSSP